MTLTLNPDQQQALDRFIEFLSDPATKYLIIHGAAGCGKSTLIKYMAKAVAAHREMYALLLQNEDVEEEFKLVLTATTNPAVAVLEDLTGLAACTIHNLLGLKPVPNFKTGETELTLNKNASIICNRLIVIDEGSMIDDVLADFIDARTHDCKVIIIGDQYQLAPVGQLCTVMETLTHPRVEMNQIMRNSGVILATGAQFRETVETGVFKAIPQGHPELIHADGPTFRKLVDAAFTRRDYSTKTAKIIAWTNDRVLEYNTHVRSVKGYPAALQVGETVHTNKPILSRKFSASVDSTVKITGIGAAYIDEDSQVSGREVELSRAYTAFHPDSQDDAKAYLKRLARKKEWPTYFQVKDTWLDLRLPYASTVHKAQGSSYDTVFIDLGDIGRCRTASDVARMLYVSISRAVRQVVFYDELPTHYAG